VNITVTERNNPPNNSFEGGPLRFLLLLPRCPLSGWGINVSVGRTLSAHGSFAEEELFHLFHDDFLIFASGGFRRYSFRIICRTRSTAQASCEMFS